MNGEIDLTQFLDWLTEEFNRLDEKEKEFQDAGRRDKALRMQGAKFQTFMVYMHIKQRTKNGKSHGRD